MTTPARDHEGAAGQTSPTREQCIAWLAGERQTTYYDVDELRVIDAILAHLRTPPGPEGTSRQATPAAAPAVTRELIDTLSDARADFEKEYAYETTVFNGSKIRSGQCRRYADAIAQAALILSRLRELRSEDGGE